MPWSSCSGACTPGSADAGGPRSCGSGTSHVSNDRRGVADRPGSPSRRPDAARSPVAQPGRTADEQAGSPVLAFFDLDNTLVHGTSAFHLVRGLRAAGLITLRDVLGAGWKHARFKVRGENDLHLAAADPRARGDHRDHGGRHGGAVGRRLGSAHRAVRVAGDRCPRPGAPREGPPGMARHRDTDVPGGGDRAPSRSDRSTGQRVRGAGRHVHGPPRRGVPARGAQGGLRTCAPGPDRRRPGPVLGVLGLTARHPAAVARRARRGGQPGPGTRRARAGGGVADDAPAAREPPGGPTPVRREAPAAASSSPSDPTTGRPDQSTEPSG